MTYVIVNNGGYRIIKQRLKSFHQNDHFIGMDFGSGGQFRGSRAVDGRDGRTGHGLAKLRALDNALANKSGPNLIEVICEGSV